MWCWYHVFIYFSFTLRKLCICMSLVFVASFFLFLMAFNVYCTATSLICYVLFLCFFFFFSHCDVIFLFLNCDVIYSYSSDKKWYREDHMATSLPYGNEVDWWGCWWAPSLIYCGWKRKICSKGTGAGIFCPSR